MAGAEFASGTPDEGDALLRSELAKWGKVVREAGIKAE
jgi:tripartite-type tricarboxylate transporter receptor subunit TctC